MEFEQEPTDEQLDGLLQDVAVPQDLKALLKQIPSQAQAKTDELVSDSTGQLNQKSATENNTARSKTWIGLMIAASLIGFGLFVAAGYLTNPNDVKTPIANSENKTTDPEKTIAAVEDNESATQLVELETEDREVQMLEAQIRAIEMAQLEARVVRAEQAATFQIDQNEVESIIAAMSEQYSVPLGMPEAKVKSRMAQVIQNFPGTRGAAMAHSYLEQSKNN